MKDIDSWPKSTKLGGAYPPRSYAVQSCQEKESEQFQHKTARLNIIFNRANYRSIHFPVDALARTVGASAR